MVVVAVCGVGGGGAVHVDKKEADSIAGQVIKVIPPMYVRTPLNLMVK